MASPEFWSDKEAAQAVVAEVKELKVAVEPFEALEKRVEELGVLVELVE